MLVRRILTSASSVLSRAGHSTGFARALLSPSVCQRSAAGLHQCRGLITHGGIPYEHIDRAPQARDPELPVRPCLIKLVASIRGQKEEHVQEVYDRHKLKLAEGKASESFVPLWVAFEPELKKAKRDYKRREKAYYASPRYAYWNADPHAPKKPADASDQELAQWQRDLDQYMQTPLAEEYDRNVLQVRYAKGIAKHKKRVTSKKKTNKFNIWLREMHYKWVRNPAKYKYNYAYFVKKMAKKLRRRPPEVHERLERLAMEDREADAPPPRPPRVPVPRETNKGRRLANPRRRRNR